MRPNSNDGSYPKGGNSNMKLCAAAHLLGGLTLGILPLFLVVTAVGARKRILFEHAIVSFVWNAMVLLVATLAVFVGGFVSFVLVVSGKAEYLSATAAQSRCVAIYAVFLLLGLPVNLLGFWRALHGRLMRYPIVGSLAAKVISGWKGK
jgi:hypothetical protein